MASSLSYEGVSSGRQTRRSSSCTQPCEHAPIEHRNEEDIMKARLEHYVAEKKKKQQQKKQEVTAYRTSSREGKKKPSDLSTLSARKTPNHQHVLQTVQNKALPARSSKQMQKNKQESDSEYMRKKLEKWQLEKEQASTTKKRKPPWKGGGAVTPCTAPDSSTKTKSTSKMLGSSVKTASASKASLTHVKENKKSKKSLFQCEVQPKQSKSATDVNGNCEINMSGIKENVTSFGDALEDDTRIEEFSADEQLVSIGYVWANAHRAKHARKHAVRFQTSPVRRSPRLQKQQASSDPSTNSTTASLDPSTNSTTASSDPSTNSTTASLDPSTSITTASLDPSTNSTTASSDPSTNTGSSITSGLDYRNKDLDMSQQLELWLAAKGKRPSTVRTVIKHTKGSDHPKQEKVKSRRSMPATCTQPIETDEPVVYSKEAEDVDLIDAKHHGKSRVTTLMEDMLTDCLTLLDTDCPVDNMKQWLSDACGRNPGILQCAKYWICKARMAALEGRSQDDIIECYELAVQHGAQPIEEIRSALEEFVGAPSPFWHDGNKPDVALPSSSDTDLVSKESSGIGYRELHNNKMETEMSASSSNIRYCVSKTPLFNRIHKVFGENAAITPISIVTPVRRSVRLEQLSATKPPGSFQSHDVCVSSLGELPVEEMDGFIYKPNKTLQAEFDAVMEVDEKLG